MKWFDPYEALDRMRAEGDADDCIQRETGTGSSTLSQPNAAQTFRDNQDRGGGADLPRARSFQPRQADAIEGKAQGFPTICRETTPEPPHGNSVGLRPRTWTGKVVSLEAWRQLSEWEKHGPNGRVWNGKSKQWEQTDEQ
ncbi:hypothetical protein Q5Y75_07940 [Ruegeria sp. 2205SS24-7]|uniref:hypothetical protein n=1 Tax=Ruegeria discodermiae TaxID=3064389 RepID=UPI0027416E45|nr:hypothetical protein [Ruegeria sp. 2205SS24-7]MDP5217144.1 hypothetical protein [Ruegeria sp. 2205SS24-7]